MSYVVGNTTYDEAGWQIDGMGHRLGPRDPNVGIDQPLAAEAANQHTTVTAILVAKQKAAAAVTHSNPVMTAAVMPNAAPVYGAAPPTVRTQSVAPQPAYAGGIIGNLSPLGWIVILGGGYWLWKHGLKL